MPPPLWRRTAVGPGLCLGALLAAAAACAPTVRLEAPERPIEINLNIKIEQEVRVRVERELEAAFDENPALFGLPGAPL